MAQSLYSMGRGRRGKKKQQQEDNKKKKNPSLIRVQVCVFVVNVLFVWNNHNNNNNTNNTIRLILTNWNYHTM